MIVILRCNRAEVDYERVINNLRRCRDEITLGEERLSVSKRTVSADGEKFNAFLEGVTNEINRRFQMFMSQMNSTFKGRIIKTGESTFGSFGLQLEVRFRERDSFRPLSSGYQSGKTHWAVLVEIW